MLKIKNLKKNYGSLAVLDIPELHLGQGIYWLKGSNGTGKTTFFKSVAGMLDFEGSILLEDKYEINRNPEAYRLRVNYTEAEPLYPDFISGKDLLKLVAEAKQSSEKQLENLIEMFEIGTYVGNTIGTYSSGMLKKISLILAFLGNPSLILLDEPLVTIDKKAAGLLLSLIQEYHTKGVSFLLSSHQDFPPDVLPIKTIFELKNKTLITS